MEAVALNVAQQRVLDELGSIDRPSFEPSLQAELRAELQDAFSPMATVVTEENDLFVSKRALGLVLSCEQHYVSDRDGEFAWSVPTARGTVAHKAIELLVGFRGEPTPLDLIEAALARLENDRSIGDFLLGLSEAERADLVASCNDQVAGFMESFPPLRRQWRPVTESRVRASFLGGALQLGGKVDLQLGYARGQEAGKVIIDLKTGQVHRSHVDDLRFYALLDTLKYGVPPRLLVSYYLDAAAPHTEAVNEDILWAAAQRTAEGVSRIVELRQADAQPTRTPSGSCNFCPLNTTCEPGKEFLSNRDG